MSGCDGFGNPSGVLIRQQRDRGFRRTFIDRKLHFAGFGYFAHWCGIVRTTATGNYAGIKNTGIHSNKPRLFSHVENYHAAIFTVGITALR